VSSDNDSDKDVMAVTPIFNIQNRKYVGNKSAQLN
jgi:hypothetical protein